jgi:hypothetical protein
MPIIFFPISADISIFALGGKTMAAGGKIYQDFIDLKPPAIFEIYAFLYKTIGISEIALRLFDFIIQLITVLFLAYTLIKFGICKFQAYLSGIIYAVSYSVLSYSQTLNPESFVGLFLLIIINLHFFHNKLFTNILKGICLGFLTGLKFTLGILLIILLIDELINKKDWKLYLKSNLAMISGYISAFLLTFLPFFNEQVRNGFFNAMKYLSFHSSQPPVDLNFIRDSIKTVGVFFGDNYSLLLFTSLVFGILLSIKNYKNEDKLSRLYLFLALSILSLFISIAVERKFSVYHFVRMYIPLSVFSSIGLFRFIKFAKQSFIENNNIVRISIGIIIIFGIIFSPLPRLLSVTIPVEYYFADKTKFNQYYQRDIVQNMRETYIKIAGNLNSNTSENSKVVVMAIGGNQINYFIKAKHSKFSQSLFYFGKIRIEEWQKDIKNEIETADYIVVQTNDIHPMLTGHYKSSMKCLEESEYFTYFTNNYDLVNKIDCFNVYKKR